MRFKIALFTLVVLNWGINAQTCCSGGVPLSNNIGLPNDGGGSFIFGLAYDYNNLNTLNAGTTKLDDDSRLRITNTVLLNAGYALTDNIAFEGLLPWVNQTRTIFQFGNENLTETSGVGDAVFLAKYTFLNPIGPNSTITLGSGVKIPFGSSDFLNELGIQLTADLQPGSGSWDGLFFLALTKKFSFRPTMNFSISSTLQLTGVNKDYLGGRATYEFGNAGQVNFGIQDQLLLLNTIFIPGLVIKYRTVGLDTIDRSDLPNTGGEWVFVRPELGFNITRNLIFNSRLELPIYSNVKGTQLTPTLRFTGGITYSIVRQTNNIQAIN